MVITSIIIFVSYLLFNIIEIKDSFILVEERQTAVTVIESLHQQFVRHGKACPVFFTGHIQDAVDSAFGLSLVKKVRFYYFL